MTPSADNYLIFIFKTIILPIYAILVVGRSIKISLGNKGQVFLAMVLNTVLQFLFFAVFFVIFYIFFMLGSNLGIENNENNGIQMLLSNLLNDPIFIDTISWAQYLVFLFYFPFSSI